MARFSAMFLPERSGFGLNELLGNDRDTLNRSKTVEVYLHRL